MYNFNPPSPCGEGQQQPALPPLRPYFNPPSPCGEGRLVVLLIYWIDYFNPPSPCGEGLPLSACRATCVPISIHPPRAGRDGFLSRRAAGLSNFNPPSPCGEGR